MGLVNCAGIAVAENRGQERAARLALRSPRPSWSTWWAAFHDRLAADAVCKNEPEATASAAC